MGKVAGVTGPLANERLDVLLQRVATADASPGAGPTIAWTCAMAAGLAEMVCAVELRKDPADPAGAAAGGGRGVGGGGWRATPPPPDTGMRTIIDSLQFKEGGEDGGEFSQHHDS
jgi:hypothetical protein